MVRMHTKTVERIRALHQDNPQRTPWQQLAIDWLIAKRVLDLTYGDRDQYEAFRTFTLALNRIAKSASWRPARLLKVLEDPAAWASTRSLVREALGISKDDFALGPKEVEARRAAACAMRQAPIPFPHPPTPAELAALSGRMAEVERQLRDLYAVFGSAVQKALAG